MNRYWGHLNTITRHKIKVTTLCFRCGLYRQGMKHDLSKYSFIELSSGMKYFQGNRSPIDAEKEKQGYSLGWLHHKGRNPHHWEYWLDNTRDGIKPIKIPIQYMIEMFCDRVAASKIYYGEHYHDDIPLQYFMRGYDYIIMDEHSKALIQHLLTYLSTYGLEKSIDYINHDVKKAGYEILNR